VSFCSICPAHWVLQQMKIQIKKRNVKVTAFRELGHTNGQTSCLLHTSKLPTVLNYLSVVTDANTKKQLEK